MRRASSFLVMLALGSCSTLAALPDPEECESDEDCPEPGDVCAPDTRVCVAGGDLPPRADLGFDIQELVGGNVVFRAEITACDKAMDYAQSRLRLSASEIEQSFELEVIADPLTPVPPETPLFDGLLTGTLELTQASRFARPPLLPPRITYPTVDTTSEMPKVSPTEVRWPRYHPLDSQPPVFEDGGFIVWRTIPVVGAPVLQMLEPPQLVPVIDDLGNETSCVADTDCCQLDNTGLACEPEDPNVCFEDVGLCTAIGNPRFAFTYAYQERCALALSGDLRMIDGETLAPIGSLGDVPLTIRHADTVGMDKEVARLGVHAIDGVAIADRPPQCSVDSDCIEGEQFCDTETSPGAGQCVLALAGRPADSGSLITAPSFLPGESPDDDPVLNPDAGTFTASVYTYCEAYEDNIGYVRSFTISASPPGPVAALSYTVDVSVPPLVGVTHPSASILKDLCVPDWGASKPLSLQLVGAPVSLVGAGPNEYTCCDVGCLPATADVASTEPTQPSTCDGRTTTGELTATVSASLVLDSDDLEAWDEAGCQPPDAGPGGVVGGIRRQMDCSAAVTTSTCTAPDLAAGKDGTPREYELRIESPPGSLFRSQITTVAVDGSETPQEIELARRVLVRGRVLLDAATCEEAAPIDGDCGSEGAIIRAERLRMPTDTDADIVGPHFHEVTTYFDPSNARQGGYILPLDPGVYLLTALPLSGSRGGPAKISVLEVREEDIELDLVLSGGQLVTLDLTDFDSRAQIIPVDRGSWRNEPHPGRADDPDPLRRFVDLNAIGECWQPADEPPQGCRIRRLISGASLSASQVGQVRFTARRDSDAAKCPIASGG